MQKVCFTYLAPAAWIKSKILSFQFCFAILNYSCHHHHTTTNIIIRMRECVWTNIYGQIESVLTRQEPLCPNPCAADSFPPEKKWIAYIMCDEVKNIYIHKCTSEDWEKYTTSSLSVVQNGLYCFAAVLNDKTTIWQVPAVCESFAKSVTRRQEDKRRNPKLGDCMKYASKPWMLI